MQPKLYYFLKSIISTHYRSLFALSALMLSHTTQANKVSDQVNLLFKARGLQAVEKLTKLSEKNGDSKGKNLTDQELCEWELESFYQGYAIPRLASALIKPSKKETNYRLVGRSGDELAQINLFISNESGKMNSISVAMLPKGWQIIFTVKNADSFNITSPNCIHVIPYSNYLQGKAIALSTFKPKGGK